MLVKASTDEGLKMYYLLKAWNQETRWGWTQYPEVAAAACDALNRGREINLYAVYEITNEEAQEHGLTGRDDALFTDDTSVADFT